MKITISIPVDAFHRAERLAKIMGISRDQFFARALSEFVARHEPESITEAMNRVVDEVGTEPDDFTRTAASMAIKRVEW